MTNKKKLLTGLGIAFILYLLVSIWVLYGTGFLNHIIP